MRKASIIIKKIIIHITNGSAWLSVLCVFMLSALIVVSVLSRYLLNKPLLGIDEISGYLNVLIGFLALAYTLQDNRHVRVDIVTNRLSPRVRNFLEMVTSILALILISQFIRTGWYTWMILVKSNERAQTYLRTPLAVPYGFMLFGWALILLMILIHLAGVIKDMRESVKEAGLKEIRAANNTTLKE